MNIFAKIFGKRIPGFDMRHFATGLTDPDNEEVFRGIINILKNYCKETGSVEGAVKTLERIIRERDCSLCYLGKLGEDTNSLLKGWGCR